MKAPFMLLCGLLLFTATTRAKAVSTTETTQTTATAQAGHPRYGRVITHRPNYDTYKGNRKHKRFLGIKLPFTK